MPPTVTALLCFGLCMGQGIRAMAEPFLRPTLHADPGLIIPWNKPVTLRCRGHPEVDWYRLKNGRNVIEDKRGAGAEATFTISSMTESTAGSYHCFYWIRSAMSESSEPLELVVTGYYYEQPQLSAQPSQEVSWGQNVTVRCRSRSRVNRFVLYREGGANSSQWGDPQSQPDFVIPVVNATHEGIYRCYAFHSQHPHMWSRPSDPLELRLTEPLLRPTLHADPGPLIPWKKSVTLRCRGPPEAAWYRLKKGRNVIEDKRGAGAEATFTISFMTENNAGSYSCLYWIGSVISEPSEPLQLVMTSYYEQPRLSAEPSQEVSWGQNVTLWCRSLLGFDRFVLYREEGANSSQWGDPQSQRDFVIPAVTAIHKGIYRCYVFHSQHPHLWSHPSDPLELNITVPATSGPRLEFPDILFGLPRLQAVILLSISALLILILLLFFLFLLLRYRRKHQSRQWTGDKEAGAEETLQRYSQAKDVPPESLYATVENVQSEEHMQVEDPQEVTYAHLIHNTPNQDSEHISPFPSEESTFYAPLAIQ